jgi:hypothetical protein
MVTDTAGNYPGVLNLGCSKGKVTDGVDHGVSTKRVDAHEAGLVGVAHDPGRDDR